MTALPENVRQLQAMIRGCGLCPRHCDVDRTAGRRGSCRVGADAVVASVGPHFGEEPVLVGHGGSGTIFLSGCNLHCVFCQNDDISQHVVGQVAPPADIASLARKLQGRGCHNVNFVSPTHVAHAIAEAIVLARRDGLAVPVVYNCGGYESVEVLKLLDGLVEIYMPDFKYADADAGLKYSDVADYPAVAAAALAEMYRQVGPLKTDPAGVATTGVLVRHLVMPGDLARSRAVVDVVAETAPAAGMNVMAQYRPCHQASQYPELMARPDYEEVRSLRQYALSRGLAEVE